MFIEYYKINSTSLGHEFEFKRFGNNGKPVMVFPTSNGKFFDYENQGMVTTLSPFIDNGDIQLICVDSRDQDAWFSTPGPHMGDNHIRYEKCITEDLIPWCKENLSINEKYLTTGCSWGGFHSLNFVLKFPHLFDSAISLSGVYSPQMICKDYYDETLYYNDMPKYVPGINDPTTLDNLSNCYLIICHGKGNYELANKDAWNLAQSLGKKIFLIGIAFGGKSTLMTGVLGICKLVILWIN